MSSSALLKQFLKLVRQTENTQGTGIAAGNAVKFMYQLSRTAAALKKAVNGKTSVFDWVVGWLAREEKMVITQKERSCRICSKEAEAVAVRAMAKTASAN